MPEMDGLELADVIKTKTLLGKPPVIMLTSLDNLIDQAARERLDLICLQKPVFKRPAESAGRLIDHVGFIQRHHFR